MFLFSEEIRTKLAKEFLEFEDYFIVDSMPLEICKFSRHSRIKSVKKNLKRSVKRILCLTKQLVFWIQASWSLFCIWYFSLIGYHKAEVHDVHFLKNIKQQMSDCVLLGDRGYLSESIQLDLFQTVKVRLETPKKDQTKKTINNNLIYLENQEKELKLYFLNYAINS